MVAGPDGEAFTLGERECSLQRRHQKLVEESPAPGLDDGQRQRLADAAARLAEAAGYRNLGTVEFLVDPADPDAFFFLEMNARLQVEHPVTELVWGLDLVELQLRIAAGEPVAGPTPGARPEGHAIEARVCAERPAAGFLPATGRVVGYGEPAGEGVRVDSRDRGWHRGDRGVRLAAGQGGLPRRLAPAGAGATRSSTRRHHRAGRGDQHRVPAPAAGHAGGARGAHDRGPGGEPARFGAAVRVGLAPTPTPRWPPYCTARRARPPGPGVRDRRRLAAGPAGLGALASAGHRAGRGAEAGGASGARRVGGGGRRGGTGAGPRRARRARGSIDVTLAGARRTRWHHARDGTDLWLGGEEGVWCWREAETEDGEAAAIGSLEAELPGKVVAVSARAGDEVSAGQSLLVIESMKMELDVERPQRGHGGPGARGRRRARAARAGARVHGRGRTPMSVQAGPSASTT